MKGKSFMKLKLRNSFYLRVCTNCPSRFWNHGRIKKNPLGFPLNTNSAPIMLYGPVGKLEMSSSAVLGVFYSVALQVAELSPCLKATFLKTWYMFMGYKCSFVTLINSVMAKSGPLVHPSLGQYARYPKSSLPSSIWLQPPHPSIVHHSTICFHVETLLSSHL